MLRIMLPFVLKVDRRNPRTQIGASLCQKILQHRQNRNDAILMTGEAMKVSREREREGGRGRGRDDSGRREEVACSVA